MADRGEDLAAIVRLSDFESLARAAMDPGAFDHAAGGAWDEVSLAENEAAWLRRRFRPRVLVDVSRVDTSTTLLGARSAMPVAIAPMSFHVIAHPDAELATFRGAASAGIPYILSTSSSRSIEDVAAAAPDGTRWFQLYLQDDPRLSRSLVDRAVATGYSAIVLTVDGPALGYRERVRRSGFVVPPLGNFSEYQATHVGRSAPVGGRLEGRGPAKPTWGDIDAVRTWSSLPLVVKGILTPEDARLAVEHGVDGIVVSNHGGRQLDRVQAPVDVLGDVVAAVGDGVEVWVDGGVRRGLDVAIALALGARGVLVGRPIMWALATSGQAGVERALSILHEELALAMQLLGTPTPHDIRPEHLVG